MRHDQASFARRPGWVLAQGGYRSLDSTAGAVAFGLWVLVALELARAAAGAWLLVAPPVATPGPWLEWLGVAVSWKTRVVLYLCNTALLVLFFLRAADNARVFGASLSEGPVRLIGIFLVPLANLVLPYFAIKDIWRGSTSPGGPGSAGAPRWLAAWWCVQILHLHGEQVVGRLTQLPDGRPDRLAVILAMAASAIVGMGAALWTARTLRKLAALQDQRAGTGV